MDLYPALQNFPFEKVNDPEPFISSYWNHFFLLVFVKVELLIGNRIFTASYSGNRLPVHGLHFSDLLQENCKKNIDTKKNSTFFIDIIIDLRALSLFFLYVFLYSLLFGYFCIPPVFFIFKFFPSFLKVFTCLLCK